MSVLSAFPSAMKNPTAPTSSKNTLSARLVFFFVAVVIIALPFSFVIVFLRLSPSSDIGGAENENLLRCIT